MLRAVGSPWRHRNLPSLPVPCPRAPRPALTLRLQLAEDGLCPPDHAAHGHGSHGLGHAADPTEARVGLLGVGVGRGDHVEGRVEQGQAGDSVDSALNPRETATSEPSLGWWVNSALCLSRKGPANPSPHPSSTQSWGDSSRGLHQVNKPG